ncbi:MAG: hypothetical protein JNM66_07755 [Bryobacterales bacterium]|nr:hypothetical protein [Bryobacterales bacterium]
MTEPLGTDLTGKTILKSWRWDRYKVQSDVEEAREKYNEARRKLALLDRERKLQPPLLLVSAIGRRKFKVTRYHVIDENTFCTEQQEEVSDG